MGLRTAETLLNIGFCDIAKWVRGGRPETLDYLLDGSNANASKAMLEVRNALYAFVQGEKVNYIGKTARSIKQRFIGYCNPGMTQRTNLRCNRNIRALLDSGTDIRIYVCTPPTEFRYGEFQIDLAAGLEESLILAFDPPWNGREETRVLTEDEDREATEETEAAATALAQTAIQNAPLAKAARAPRSNNLASFQIKLGSAYYNQGLINPGVEASQRLGEHGDPIIVYLGDESRQVDSMINRTANVNGSCRIVGNNRRIADWFQQNFQPGDIVEGIVQDPHHILLQGPHSDDKRRQSNHNNL